MAESSADFMRKMSKGNTEFGLPSIEPLFVKKLDLGNNGDDSAPAAVSITQKYDNVSIYGMTDLKIETIRCLLRLNISVANTL